MAVIEFARDVLELKDADSVEFNPDTKNPVIHIMEDQKNITKKRWNYETWSIPLHTCKRNTCK